MRSIIPFRIILAALCASMLYCCQKIVQPPASEFPSSFKNIYIKGIVNLNMSKGIENEVTEASGFSVKVVIQNNALTITGWGNVNLKLKECDTIFINDNCIINNDTATKLNHVVFMVNEGASVTVNNINPTDFMDVFINGIGIYTFSGNTNKLNVYANSASKFSGFNLKSKKCKATVNSTGHADIFVSDSLTAIINGDGNINYKGDPISVTPIIINGSGQIIKK